MKENSTNSILAPSPEYPGYVLTVGSRGSDVSIMQSYLNAIGKYTYKGITALKVDGIYGKNTALAVNEYQAAKQLKIDGKIGPITWDSIVGDYAALPEAASDDYPGYVLRPGTVGYRVSNIQEKLNVIGQVYPAINQQKEDGIYGRNMSERVRVFQRIFGLAVDGAVGRLTWDKIIDVYTSVMNGENTKVSTEYGGALIREGSQNDNVKIVQGFLNRINEKQSHGRQKLTVDGVFGRNTKNNVGYYQAYAKLKADGIVGRDTWNSIIKDFNGTL